MKATRVIAAAPVVAFFAKAGRRGNARAIVDCWLKPSHLELPLFYPMTDESHFDDPPYRDALARFYKESAMAIAAHLEAGRDVALLSEGDPFLYGSFMHLFIRLRERFAVTIVPGVSSICGAWGVAGAPMTWGDDALVVLPATLPLGELIRRLALADAAVIMKIGRNFARAREALAATGMAERAIYVERATMAGEVVTPLCQKAGRRRALFLVDSGAGQGAPAVSGRLMIVGLGPGPAKWMTPEAGAAIEAASDVVGYGPYIERLALRSDQRVHASDNRLERDRARLALTLAAEGRAVAVVSGGDPGVFAMAAAVFEAIEDDPQWLKLDVAVSPGVSAMQAAAARLGAPLGHDFCAISLSDNLKPWAVIERRLEAAADGDFVIALYNPASRARPTRIVEAFDLMRRRKAGATPVAFARAVGRADEKLTLTTLDEADASLADMATLIVVGSSETRFIAREGARPWMVTPRSYGARAMSRDPGQNRVEIMHRLGFGRGRPAHDDDFDLKHARRLDLGVGGAPPAVLGHQRLDALVFHQRSSPASEKGPRARISLQSGRASISSGRSIVRTI